MSPRWLFFPTAAGETVLDTYTQSGGMTWSAANKRWNGINSGSWSSTGTASGTYLVNDSGSYIRDIWIRLGPMTGNVPSNAQIRISFTPSNTTRTATWVSGGLGGDERFDWDGTNPTVAEMEEGGTDGWNNTDTLTIQLFTP